MIEITRTFRGVSHNGGNLTLEEKGEGKILEKKD